MNTKILIAIAALLIPLTVIADKGEKASVQKAMKKFVNDTIGEDGLLPIIHEGKILQLALAPSEKYPDAFHAGVKNIGALYTSCADFVNPKTGDTFDIDFLVKKSGDQFIVVQPLVHSVNGKKSPYDLAH